MARVTLNPEVKSQLHNLAECLEICDESGQTLGYFLTVAEYQEMWREWAKLKFPEEELERIWNEEGESTTAEVLARLERL